jgi:hypothetical protein
MVGALRGASGFPGAFVLEKAELDNADVGFALADMASIFDEAHAFERRRR